MADLSGRVALVTGAASGIGAATAGLLAACGATVCSADLRAPHPGPTALQLDVREEGDWERAMRGAALSRGGKPTIALPTTDAGGTVSRITADLKQGAGVVTTRGHVHWVVTEYGAVNLHGKTLRERGEALVSIAHPDFRAELRSHLNQVRRFATS